MKEMEPRIREFLNTLGFASSLMAGFAFTAVIEIQPWTPQFANMPFISAEEGNLIKESVNFLLVVAFANFMMPLLLNIFFLNVEVDSELKVKKLRQVQVLYTLFIGLGIGSLEGALCLFVLGTCEPYDAVILVVGIVTSLIIALAIIRWFKRGLDKPAAVSSSANAPATSDNKPDVAK